MTTTTVPTTPRNLRRALAARGMSQRELAAAAGIGEAEISRIVGRGMKPTTEQAARISAALAGAA